MMLQRVLDKLQRPYFPEQRKKVGCGCSTIMQKEKYIHNTVSMERKKKKTDHKTINNISMHYDNKTSFLKSM